MSDASASPRDVGRAASIFETWIGFDIAEAAPRRLRDFLVARSTHLGYDTVAAYLDDLPADRPNTPEAQRLINVATNGLTAFWRDESQLSALGDALEARSGARASPLRVWCAGCSTGEEPYSVAMMAAERGVRVQVLGTDVNTDSLEVARRREYDDWALRRLSEARRNRWFESREGRYLLDHELARAVDFRHHNLLDEPARPDAGGWDFILCRNVLIYLTPSARDAILSRFASTLADDGLLFVGPSEQVDSAASLEVRKIGEVYAYGRGAAVVGAELPASRRSLDEPTADFQDHDAVLRLLSAGVDHDDADSALACFEAAAGYDPFTPEIHALLADLLEDAGALERARAAFANVLFLDPNNWWAALRMARLHERLGDRVEARRYWTMARDIRQTTSRPPFHSSLSIGPLEGIEASSPDFEAEIGAAMKRLSPG